MATGKYGNGCFLAILGAVAVLIVVSGLPLFLLYKYYDHAEAGIWIYETPGKWLAENEAAARALTYRENSEVVLSAEGYVFHLNERIDWVNTDSYPSPRIRRLESRLVDRKNGQVLVKEIRFTLGDCGNAMPVIFWLQECRPQNHIGSIATQFKDIGRKVGAGKVAN